MIQPCISIKQCFESLYVECPATRRYRYFKTTPLILQNQLHSMVLWLPS